MLPRNDSLSQRSRRTTRREGDHSNLVFNLIRTRQPLREPIWPAYLVAAQYSIAHVEDLSGEVVLEGSIGRLPRGADRRFWNSTSSVR